jgi:hypothetical protein
MTRIALVTLVLVGCASSDVIAIGPCRGPYDCASGVCEAGVCREVVVDASSDAADAADGGGFCDGEGPLVLIGDTTGEVLCAGEVAQTTFRYALCTCETLALSSSLVTDAFDSRQGPYTTGQGGASVGVNAGLGANGSVGVAGALTVSGGVMLGPMSGLVVRGDLSAGGAVASNSPVTVLSDARVDGSITASALTVAGTLTVPEALAIDVSPGPLSVGNTVRGAVDVAPPCDCAPERRLDVDALAAARRVDNDNAAIGLTAGALVGLASDTSRSLPCGRYYLDAIDTSAHVTLEVTGRVALFIAGNILALGDLTITLGAGAELDVFVAGDVRVDGRFVIGDPARAARTRLYIGGTQSIALSADASIAANVYAPGAALQASAPLEVFGSIFAEQLAASASVTLHYDRAVLGAASTCVLPSTCESCADCQNQSCNAGGVCGACTTSSDCCAPLECVGGVCMVEII